MNSYRCGDTMILKKLYDYGGYYWGWKCTRCGEIIDQPVFENQRVERITQWEKSQKKGMAIIR